MAQARVKQITQAPDANGVYKAKVEIQSPTTGKWIEKKAESNFYPDRMRAAEVEAAIRHAYADALRSGGLDGDRFLGDSGFGFKIEGFIKGYKMTTAYPIREKAQ